MSIISLHVVLKSSTSQMEREMEELKRQRDLAQSQLELERKAHKIPKVLYRHYSIPFLLKCPSFYILLCHFQGMNQHGPSSDVVRCLSFHGDNDESVHGKLTPEPQSKTAVRRQAMVRRSVTSTDPSMLVHEIRKLEQRQRQLGEEANRALEVLHKEVASHRLGNQEAAENIAKLLSEIQNMQMANSISEETMIGEADQANLIEEISRFKSQGSTIESLERKLENVQKSIDQLVSSFATREQNPPSECKTTPPRKKKILPFNLSNSANMQNIIRPPCSPLSSSCKVRENERENKAPDNDDVSSAGGTVPWQGRVTPLKSDESGNCGSLRDGTPVARNSNSVNVKKMQRMFKNAAEENIRSIRAYVTELKERVAKLQYQKQLLVCQVKEREKKKFIMFHNKEVMIIILTNFPLRIRFISSRYCNWKRQMKLEPKQQRASFRLRSHGT